MKIIRRILFITIGIVVLVGLIGMLALYYISSRALPDYNKDYAAKGLHAKVHIVRDEFAMPHIYAENEHDLYFATGFVMAQDRLWQMDLLRRVTMGRLSEIFGKDMVKTDHLLRTLRMSKKSKEVIAQSDDALVECLDAFTQGVNAFIEKQGRSLPPEFTVLGYKPEPWQSFHTVNLIGYMAWDLAGSWQNEIALYKLKNHLPDSLWRQLFPEPQKTTIYETQPVSSSAFSLLDGNHALEELGLEIFNGSNNWAVNAHKSKDGHALMANDMHLGFGAPGIWYQIHQVIEGKLNVTGLALPGSPCVINGHNDSIGWGMTNLYVDEMDFFVEKTDVNHPNQYFYNGEWLPMEIVNEKIAVKGGDTIEKINRFTHHGPVISEFKDIENEVISMRWTGNDYSNELRSVYLLNRARNWSDFRQALTTMLAVSQNVVFADAKGNIGLQTASAVPVRNEGIGIQPVPGDTDRFEWKSTVPFDSLPFEFNPPSGYVSSANNRTVSADYPYYIGFWYDNSFRIDRIRQLLNEKPTLDSHDFMQIQNDQTSLFVLSYVPQLLAVLEHENSFNASEQKMFEALKDWNGRMSASMVQPAVFELFFLNFMKEVMADELGEAFYKSFPSGLMRHLFGHFWNHPLSGWIDKTDTPEKESFEQIVILAFKQTVAQLENLLGADTEQWTWGGLHQLTLKHPMGKVKILDQLFHFNKGPVAVGGSFHTVNPMAYAFHQPFDVVHGASQRHIFNMGRLEDSYMVIPTGISGIPKSPYYCNQLNDFLSGTYHHDLFHKSDVESGRKFEMWLSPAENSWK